MGPDLSFEEQAWADGYRAVAGVDEVGRGPLAGPVTAAAVILDPERVPEGLNDSKKLSAPLRARLAEVLWSTARVAVAHASVEEIDELNILRASHLAMERALVALGEVDFALIDGNMVPRGVKLRTRTVIKGDARSLSIAAASIIAKEARDKIMVDLAQQFPGYDWGKNMGYPTARHKAAIMEIGVTPHHRRSFKPIHNILYQEKL